MLQRGILSMHGTEDCILERALISWDLQPFENCFNNEDQRTWRSFHSCEMQKSRRTPDRRTPEISISPSKKQVKPENFANAIRPLQTFDNIEPIAAREAASPHKNPDKLSTLLAHLGKVPESPLTLRTHESSLRTSWESDCARVQEHIRENHLSTSFLFAAHYDKSQLGCAPDLTGPVRQGLEMIHSYYSGRQNISESGSNGGAATSGVTFEDIQRANSTMSAAEFSKFLHDMCTFRLPTEIMMTIFQFCNLDNLNPGTLITEMNYREFIRSLVCTAIYCYGDMCTSHLKCLDILSRELMLNDPQKLRDHIFRMSRACAGFGAWKAPDEEVRALVKQNKATKRRSQKLVDILPTREVLNDLVKVLESKAKVIKMIHWSAFAGPYIGMLVPLMSAVGRFRYMISVKNMGENSVRVGFRVVGLDFVSLKFCPPNLLGAGISCYLEIFFDSHDTPAGEYLGRIEVITGDDQDTIMLAFPVYLLIAPKTLAASVAVNPNTFNASVAASTVCNRFSRDAVFANFSKCALDERGEVVVALGNGHHGIKRYVTDDAFMSIMRSFGLRKDQAESLFRTALKIQHSKNAKLDIDNFCQSVLPSLCHKVNDRIDRTKSADFAALNTSLDDELENSSLSRGLCYPLSLKKFGQAGVFPSTLSSKTSLKSPTPLPRLLPSISRLEMLIKKKQ